MSLKLFVNTPDQYQSFIKYLEERINLLHKTLEQASDPQDVYRCQGEIKALRRLLSLRDEINRT